jgi:hypothetical protein
VGAAPMSHTLFRDAILLALISFMCMVVWILPHLNPPTAKDDMIPPGNLVAFITWPEGNVDVDLWLDGPGEPVPVGYSNKGGVLWNLLRDDLGTIADVTSLNMETGFSRGIIPGEYRINVQCYRCPLGPVDVHVEVSMKAPSGAVSTIATSTVTLRRHFEEKTALAFRITESGEVDQSSMNTLFKPLRSGSK